MLVKLNNTVLSNHKEHFCHGRRVKTHGTVTGSVTEQMNRAGRKRALGSTGFDTSVFKKCCLHNKFKQHS